MYEYSTTINCVPLFAGGSKGFLRQIMHHFIISCLFLSLVIVFIKDSIYTNWLVSVIDLRREIDRVGRVYIRIWRGNHYDKNDFKILTLNLL
jgi:hypothetical protein